MVEVAQWPAEMAQRCPPSESWGWADVFKSGHAEVSRRRTKSKDAEVLLRFAGTGVVQSDGITLARVASFVELIRYD